MMITWERLASVVTREGDEIVLRKRGSTFEIRFNGMELMSSANHHSEDDLALSSIARCKKPPMRILIGGLGLGFTLRAVLDQVAEDAEVVVCEIVPQIVEWNLTHISALNGDALRDPRVDIINSCVLKHLAKVTCAYDLILLDTDNGPEFLVRPDNGTLYQSSGLHLVCDALKEEGIAAFWSATADPQFERALTALPWHWSRQDISVMTGRLDAVHYIYNCEVERVRVEAGQ